MIRAYIDENQDSWDLGLDSWDFAPILVYANLDKPFLVITDASNVSIGSVLSQLDESGNEKVILL